MANTRLPLLQIRDLTVSYRTPQGGVTAVAGVDLDVAAGECVGLVGESGSGKTQLLLSILGLLSPQARIAGSVCYRGTELLGLRAGALNRIRGAIRSEERRVGKECTVLCRSRWSPYH